MLINCFVDLPELKPRVEAYVESGMSEREAGLRVLAEEHQALHTDLNDFKKAIGKKPDAYVAPEVSKEFGEIQNEYKTKIDGVNAVKSAPKFEDKIQTEFGVPKEEAATVGAMANRVFDELLSPPKKQISLGYAPLRVGKVENLNDTDKIFAEKKFKEWRNMAVQFASDLGITVKTDKPTIGIYSGTTESKEASSLITIEATEEQAEVFAALMGTMAPDVQHSVMINTYNENGVDTEHHVKFKTAEKAHEFIENRKDYGISDVSFDPATNTVLVLDIDRWGVTFDQNKFRETYGTDIEGIEHRGVTNRFLEEADYAESLARGRDSLSDKQLIGRTNLSDVYELAQKRFDRRGGVHAALSEQKKGELIQTAIDYVKKVGQDFGVIEPTDLGVRVSLDPASSKAAYNAYQKLAVDNSSDPAVREAYDQLVKETEAQYDYIVNDLGINVEFIESDPYDNSTHMFSDIFENNNLRVFKGGEPHAFLSVAGADGITANEKLRAVHDYFGHTVEGNEFGGIGEERAWVAHSKLFSPLAQKAMTTETKGQNSWVNNDPVNKQALADMKAGNDLIRVGRVADGNVLVKKGQEAFQFAEQKVDLLPDVIINSAPARDLTPLQKARQVRLQAQAKLKANGRNLGIYNDPKQQAIDMFDYHKSLVAEAIELIKVGMSDFKDFVKEMAGVDKKDAQMAWDEAQGGVKQTLLDFQSDPDVSGIKKSLVSDDLIRALDLDKISDTDMMALGQKIIETGEVDPAQISLEISGGVYRALQPKEVVALIYYKTQLDNTRRELTTQLNNAIIAGNDKAPLTKKLNLINDDIMLFDVMSVITAQQQSLAFRLRRGLLDRDYNLVGQIERYKSTNHGFIEPEIEAKFIALDKELQAVRDQLIEAEKRFVEAEEKAAIGSIVDDVKRGVKSNAGRKSTLTPEEQILKKQLANKYRVFNDATRMAVIILEKDFRTYAGLILKEAKGDFKVFAVKMMKAVGKDIKQYLPQLYDEIGGKGTVDMAEVNEKPAVVDGELVIPASYIRDQVEAGITDINDLSEAVRNEILPDLPNITIREVRDAITRYGKTVNKTSNEIQQQVNTAKRVGRMYSRLEDLERKKTVVKTGKEINVLSEKERELKRKISALEALLPKTPATTEERQERRVNYLTRFIAEKEARLRVGDFSPKAKPAPLTSNAEMRDLEIKANKIRNEYDIAHYENERRNRSDGRKIWDAIIDWGSGLSRALVVGLDAGAFFVQGVIYTLSSNPKDSYQVFKNSIRSGLGVSTSPFTNLRQFMRELGSEDVERQLLAQLRSESDYGVIKASGLAIQEPNARMGEKDDALQASVINTLWKYSVGLMARLAGKRAQDYVIQLNPYRAGERAYTGAINSMRVQLFREFTKALEMDGMTFESHPAEYKRAANTVNNMTFRGRLRFMESSSKELAIVFFAPRKVTATLALTNPAYWVDLWVSNPVIAKKALFKMATFITANVAMTLAVSALMDDDEEEVVSNPDLFNPYSSDFMQMRFGNTRVNNWGGTIGNVVLYSRFIMGNYKSSTSAKVSKLGESLFVPTHVGLLGTFARNKFAPASGLLYKVLDQRVGSEISWEDEAMGQVKPLWLQGMKELEKEHPHEMRHFFTAISILGMSVNTYGTAEFLDPRKDEKLLNLVDIKNASFKIKERQNVGMFDITTAEKRKPTKEEYIEYKQVYGDYVKDALNLEYNKLKDMTMVEFEAELVKIKREATVDALKEISGVTPEMVVVNDEKGEKHDLSPKQIKIRMGLIKTYIATKGANSRANALNKTQGKNPSIVRKAVRDAEKKVLSDALSDSREAMLDLLRK